MDPKMPIKITRTGRMYEAEVTPPHGHGAYWKTDRSVGAKELIESLRNLGCHQTDISDAFYEADPEWVFRLSQ